MNMSGWHSFVEISFGQWRPMTVRGDMGFKRRKSRDSSSARCVRTRCWLKLPSLRAGESGIAVLAPNPTSRAKCRRCKIDIPAGLHGKHLQAFSLGMLGMARWRWVMKQTVVNIWTCEGRISPRTCGNWKVSSASMRQARRCLKSAGRRGLRRSNENMNRCRRYLNKCKVWRTS